MKQEREHLTSNISFKTIATQKAEFDKIARSNNLPTGEWVRSILEMNKYSYGKVGEPSENELEKDRTINKLKENIELLKLENRYAENLYSELEKENLSLKSNVTKMSKELELNIVSLKEMNEKLEQSQIEITKANYKLDVITNNINNMIKIKNKWDFQQFNLISELESLLVINGNATSTQS
jgi:hypothetical protein